MQQQKRKSDTADLWQGTFSGVSFPSKNEEIYVDRATLTDPRKIVCVPHDAAFIGSQYIGRKSFFDKPQKWGCTRACWPALRFPTRRHPKNSHARSPTIALVLLVHPVNKQSRPCASGQLPMHTGGIDLAKIRRACLLIGCGRIFSEPCNANMFCSMACACLTAGLC